MKFFLNILLLTTCATAFGATTSSYRSPPPPPAPKASQESMHHTCKQLSQAEQEFAAQLSPPHKGTFCGVFNGEQRAQALAIVVSKSPQYKGKTPDDAVEMVMKASRVQHAKESQNTHMQEDKAPPPPPKSYRRARRAQTQQQS